MKDEVLARHNRNRGSISVDVCMLSSAPGAIRGTDVRQYEPC